MKQCLECLQLHVTWIIYELERLIWRHMLTVSVPFDSESDINWKMNPQIKYCIYGNRKCLICRWFIKIPTNEEHFAASGKFIHMTVRQSCSLFVARNGRFLPQMQHASLICQYCVCPQSHVVSCYKNVLLEIYNQLCLKSYSRALWGCSSVPADFFNRLFSLPWS